MADGWRPIVVPDEIYERARKYYDEHKEDLKLKNGVRRLNWLSELLHSRIP